jgi:hypothetical protein
MDGASAGITLPKRSVSIIEIPCRRGDAPAEFGG